jgi:hypothetical protein
VHKVHCAQLGLGTARAAPCGVCMDLRAQTLGDSSVQTELYTAERAVWLYGVWSAPLSPLSPERRAGRGARVSGLKAATYFIVLTTTW